MENRGLFFSLILHHWRVDKRSGADKNNFLLDGENFGAAMTICPDLTPP
jgi:hypothetical protein